MQVVLSQYQQCSSPKDAETEKLMAGEDDIEWQACVGDDLWQDYNKCTGVRRLFKLEGSKEEAYYKINMPGAMESLEIHEKE